MDMGWRSARLPDLSAQPALERALPLAVPRTDAQHPSRRPRRHPSTATIFSSANAAGSSFYRAHLGGGIVCASLLGASPALSRTGLVLRGFLHRVLRSSRKKLLSRPRVSHAACGRGGGDRIPHRGPKAFRPENISPPPPFP